MATAMDGLRTTRLLVAFLVLLFSGPLWTLAFGSVSVRGDWRIAAAHPRRARHRCTSNHRQVAQGRGSISVRGQLQRVARPQQQYVSRALGARNSRAASDIADHCDRQGLSARRSILGTDPER